MKQLLGIILVTVFTLLISACDQQGRPLQELGLDKLSKGVSTEMDVRTVMGQPDTIRDEPDGSRILEYPKGPEGHRTWFFTIGKDGKLVDYKQVLTEENFANIKPGMSMDEVRRVLGKPRNIAQFKLKNEEVWDWGYIQPTQKARLFNVHFDINSRQVMRTSMSESPHSPY
jgi:outer membrane protein assembly factor BamE (lipoprotein component of BamABCDE complex)